MQRDSRFIHAGRRPTRELVMRVCRCVRGYAGWVGVYPIALFVVRLRECGFGADSTSCSLHAMIWKTNAKVAQPMSLSTSCYPKTAGPSHLRRRASLRATRSRETPSPMILVCLLRSSDILKRNICGNRYLSVHKHIYINISLETRVMKTILTIEQI